MRFLKIVGLLLVGVNCIKIESGQPNLTELRSSPNEFVHQLSLTVPDKKPKKGMTEKEALDL